MKKKRIKTTILSFYAVVIIFILGSSCKKKDVYDMRESELINNVIDFYETDSLASYYVSRFSRFDKDWKGFLLNEVDTFEMRGLGLVAYLFSLPQNCAGCYNYYKVLCIVQNEERYNLFPLVDDYYYQSIDGGNYQSLLGISLNKFFVDYEPFRDLDLWNKESHQALKSLMDFIVVKVLKKGVLLDKDTFDEFLGSRTQDTSCLDSLLVNREEVLRKLGSKQSFIYANNGALYEFTFSKNESKPLNVSVKLYPENCYDNLLL